jgi:hypothetical protein
MCVCILILWVSNLLIWPATNGWDFLSFSQIPQKISRGKYNFFTSHKQETQRLKESFFYTFYQRLSHNKFVFVRYMYSYFLGSTVQIVNMLPVNIAVYDDVYPRYSFRAGRMKLFLSFPQLNSVSSIHAWPCPATEFCFTVITLSVAHLAFTENDEEFNFVVIHVYSSCYRWRYSEECTEDYVVIYSAHIIYIHIHFLNSIHSIV